MTGCSELAHTSSNQQPAIRGEAGLSSSVTLRHAEGFTAASLLPHRVDYKQPAGVRAQPRRVLGREFIFLDGRVRGGRGKEGAGEPFTLLKGRSRTSKAP